MSFLPRLFSSRIVLNSYFPVRWASASSLAETLRKLKTISSSSSSSQTQKKFFPSYNEFDSPSPLSKKYSDLDFRLDTPDWKSIQLPPVVKNNYEDHPSILSMTPQEIEDFRQKHNIQADRQLPAPITSFSQLWSAQVINLLKQQNFVEPSPIQSQTWPALGKGYDVIGIAQTGSGKTLAYLLPALLHVSLQKDSDRRRGPKCLVIAPTRELAQQINGEFQRFQNCDGDWFSAVLYGGATRRSQENELRVNPDFVFATPGRLMDFVKTGQLSLNQVSYLVMDEADRLLDMGFERQLRQILGQLRPDRQTAMFTATWPQSVRLLARDFTNSPKTITVGNADILQGASNVLQVIRITSEHSKPELLDSLLHLLKDKAEENNDIFRVLVFCNEKRTCNNVQAMLSSMGFRSATFHGDKEQAYRERALAAFKSGQIDILVASDAASRGLDVKDISFVILFDFPKEIESYVHRIGRTGRAGKQGVAVSFFTEKDLSLKDGLIRQLRATKQEIPSELADLGSFNFGSSKRGF